MFKKKKKIYTTDYATKSNIGSCTFYALLHKPVLYIFHILFWPTNRWFIENKKKKKEISFFFFLNNIYFFFLLFVFVFTIFSRSTLKLFHRISYMFIVYTVIDVILYYFLILNKKFLSGFFCF